jgi:hypothetical protein
MDQINKVRCVLAVTLFFVLASSFGAASDESSGSRSQQIQLAVSCLVKAPYLRENLDSIGLATNSSAVARYHVGDIPELGPTPGEIQIILYSKSGRDAWLFFADPNTGGAFTAVRNAYRLRRVKSRWTADYGNGGPAVYSAVGRFATNLSQRPALIVRLVPGGATCTTDK